MEPTLPFPNRVLKRPSADNTNRATDWDDRSRPELSAFLVLENVSISYKFAFSSLGYIICFIILIQKGNYMPKFTEVYNRNESSANRERTELGEYERVPSNVVYTVFVQRNEGSNDTYSLIGVKKNADGGEEKIEEFSSRDSGYVIRDARKKLNNLNYAQLTD